MAAPGRIAYLLLGSSLAAVGCLANTDGTGKGSGKETGGCVDGVFCEADLQCVYGYCVGDDQAGSEDMPDTGPLDEASTTAETTSTAGTDTTTDTTGTDTTTTTDGELCGNGAIDLGESCDGSNFGATTCATLGYDQGTPSCTAECTVDPSTCSNAPQPSLGKLYSHCLVDDNCPGLDGCATVVAEGELEPFDGFCTNYCMNDGECAVDVGGTAVPECNDSQPRYCQLDCADGKTCPQGMMCVALKNGDFVCY